MAKTTTTRQTSRQTTKNVLDGALLQTILSGLTGAMTPGQIEAFAENLLRPQLNAGLEAARRQHETTRLSREQEIEDLAASLARSIAEQNAAYRQSMADVETAALARGMGRSSYTLQSLASQGDALAGAVRELTEENARNRAQIQQQIAQSAQQSAQTQERLQTDYAAQLAAKVQELTQQQRKEQNSNYMTAVSAAMGRETTGETTGSTVSGSSGSSGGKKKKEETGEKPAADVPRGGGAGGRFAAKAMG